MYTGHFGIALLGKGARRQLPLWMCIGAAYAPDLFQKSLQFSGLYAVPHVADFAQSAVFGLFLALLIGGGYLAYDWGNWRSALVLALLTVVHVGADLLTGHLPLWPGAPDSGLFLYRYPGWDFLLEAVVVVAGWGVYYRSLPRRRRRWLAWLIPVVLLASQWVFLQIN